MSSKHGEIKVSDIMLKEVLTAGAHTTVTDIMRLLNNYMSGAVIITGENGIVRGIVTESDVISAILDNGSQAMFFPCERIMNTELISVTMDHDIDTAYMMMSLNMVRRLPVTDNEGRLQGIITLHDIANAWRRKTHMLKQQTLELESIAKKDSLTGAYNKRHAITAINSYVKLGEKFSIMIIDIDHFKQINDIYGHLAGDSVIRETAGIIRSQLRAVDTLARYGGDEFIVVCPVSDLESVFVAAERLRLEVSERKFEYGQDIFFITISIGVAESNDDIKSAGDIIRLADNCLYESKKRGRNLVGCEGFSVVNRKK